MKQKISDKTNLNGKGVKVGMVISEFNFDIGSGLLKEALNEVFEEE